ncbi:MAG: hypothetical protein HYY29_03395 [Chloroflexi bacterium]|nr:hypothetical protein [Chloroflexota bacterium]MBI4329722.1 hypothetical protein [Chloroflexota bacterium]
MKTLAATISAILYVLTLSSVPALGQAPSLPHAFFGTVTINGQPAPAGARIEARGAGVSTGISGNPLTTTQQGLYGGESGIQLKLIVQGNITEGAALSFFVNGVLAPQSAQWRTGQVTRLDLAVATVAPAVTPAPTAAPSPQPTAAPTVAPPATPTPAPAFVSQSPGGGGSSGAPLSGPTQTATIVPATPPRPDPKVSASASPAKSVAQPPAAPVQAPAQQKPPPPAPSITPATQVPIPPSTPQPQAVALPERVANMPLALPADPAREPRSPAIPGPAAPPEETVHPGPASPAPAENRGWFVAGIAAAVLVGGFLLYKYLPRKAYDP